MSAVNDTSGSDVAGTHVRLYRGGSQSRRRIRYKSQDDYASIVESHLSGKKQTRWGIIPLFHCRTITSSQKIDQLASSGSRELSRAMMEPWRKGFRISTQVVNNSVKLVIATQQGYQQRTYQAKDRTFNVELWCSSCQRRQDPRNGDVGKDGISGWFGQYLEEWSVWK